MMMIIIENENPGEYQSNILAYCIHYKDESKGRKRRIWPVDELFSSTSSSVLIKFFYCLLTRFLKKSPNCSYVIIVKPFS